MPIELYQFLPSPPCRMILLALKHLDIETYIKDVNFSKGENLEAAFIQNFYCASKINPQHTIPTIIDNGFVLTESRAILMYLANKYGQSDKSLYPTDPDKRAVVDMRLCFDLGTLYVRFSETYFPVMYQKLPLDSVKLKTLNETLGYVENFLEGDFMAVILSTLEACGPDLYNFHKITKYLERCAKMMRGWEEVNLAGANMFGKWFKAALAESIKD